MAIRKDQLEACRGCGKPKGHWLDLCWKCYHSKAPEYQTRCSACGTSDSGPVETCSNCEEAVKEWYAENGLTHKCHNCEGWMEEPGHEKRCPNCDWMNRRSSCKGKGCYTTKAKKDQPTQEKKELLDHLCHACKKPTHKPNPEAKCDNCRHTSTYYNCGPRCQNQQTNESETDTMKPNNTDETNSTSWIETIKKAADFMTKAVGALTIGVKLVKVGVRYAPSVWLLVKTTIKELSSTQPEVRGFIESTPSVQHLLDLTETKEQVDTAKCCSKDHTHNE